MTSTLIVKIIRSMFLRLIVLGSIIASIGYYFIYVAPYSSINLPEEEVQYKYLYNDIVKNQAPGVSLPLVVVLHDSGENALITKEYMTGLDADVRIVFLEASEGFKMGKTWAATTQENLVAAGKVHRAITHLQTQYQTEGKPILIGLGQGAIIAGHVAIDFPDDYSRAIVKFNEAPPVKAYKDKLKPTMRYPRFDLIVGENPRTTDKENNAYVNAIKKFISDFKSGGIRTELLVFKTNESWNDEMTYKIDQILQGT